MRKNDQRHQRDQRKPSDQDAPQRALRIGEFDQRIADIGRVAVAGLHVRVDAGLGNGTEETEIEREVTLVVRRMRSSPSSCCWSPITRCWRG